MYTGLIRDRFGAYVRATGKGGQDLGLVLVGVGKLVGMETGFTVRRGKRKMAGTLISGTSKPSHHKIMLLPGI